jgi:protein-L-isoaspartate(D-aspartate) O-methyltransferase
MTIAARKIRLIMELRRSGITQTSVLSAIERVPREDFIPNDFLDKAYDNIALPIGQGQTISQPIVVATMTQELELNDRHTVLEIGTGSGYQATILSHLARRVYSIERHKPLADIASQRFDDMKIRNITTKVGDGYRGWPDAAPFDRVIVTAAADEGVVPILMDQLVEGGIMVLPIRVNALKEQLVKIVKTADGEERTNLMEVRFVPLVSEREMYNASS